MANCPACARPTGPGRPRCLYCGAPLPEASLAAPETAATVAVAVATEDGRSLVACDPGAAQPAALAAALGLGVYEASQLVKRGGWQALRTLPHAEADALAVRLRSAGAVAATLTTGETRAAARPLLATGGHWTGERLELDTEGGPLALAAAELLLVVRGPIAREFQAQEAPGWRALRRVRINPPQPGYRFHLHRRADGPPLELDPATFAFRQKVVSAQLQIGSWCEELARAGVSQDDDFRRLTVVLSYTPGKAEAAAGRSAPRREKNGDRLLDNIAQFRAYSAWRAVLARRIAPPH